jgi:hypothetical protein
MTAWTNWSIDFCFCLGWDAKSKHYNKILTTANCCEDKRIGGKNLPPGLRRLLYRQRNSFGMGQRTAGGFDRERISPCFS